MKNVLTVRIPPELGREIDKVLKTENIAVSDLIRESLTRYVALKRFRALRKYAQKKFAAKRVYTEEDIFKIIS